MCGTSEMIVWRVWEKRGMHTCGHNIKIGITEISDEEMD